jgi:hypothetical protein
MVEKSLLLKVFAIVLVVWFFAGVVLLTLPNPYIEPCKEKCSAAGFDTVLGAWQEKCWCRSSISREEKIIENK